MNTMIKVYRPKPLSSLPLCTNVYNYGPSGGGGGGGTGEGLSVSRLVPASDVGRSSSGNTIGVLNTSFVPSRIDNEQRALFGLSTVSIPTTETYVPVSLSLGFSTSTPVDIVDRVFSSSKYESGTSGFYFRNEIPSNFFYMLGSTSPDASTTTFGRRLVIVSIPQTKDPNSSSISSIPGFVGNFQIKSVGNRYFPFDQVTFNLNEALDFTSQFSLAAPQGVGALQPIDGSFSIDVGEVKTIAQNSSEKRLDYRSIIDNISFVCFS